MALRKAKQIQHSPPQRLCSTSNRCKSRQLILLQQPRSHDDCCWVCGARAEQHPCPGRAPRRRRGPPGITLPLDAALLQPPLAFRCALHALPARSRWRQRLRHRPRRWDGECPCRYTCSCIIQGFGGSSQIILSTEINKQLPWKVMRDLRKTGEVCRSGTLQQEKARLPTPACSFLGQPRLTQEKEQHHSQSCHALVQVRKTETMKIKNATLDDSRLIRKSHV